MKTHRNVEPHTVDGFGQQWSRFTQDQVSERESDELFNRYFHIFPWQQLPASSCGFDAGCGSGRWAKWVAPRVGKLHLADASAAALHVARENLQEFTNCEYHVCSVENLPFDDASMDFGYSLGVLHHIPDTLAGIRACVAKIKPGGFFLVYLYYRFDNRPLWYRFIWWCSDLFRRVNARLPFFIRARVAELMAMFVYWPLSRMARVLEMLGCMPKHFPLSAYRNLSFYTLRTDALDRLGTRLEQRFTKAEIEQMLTAAGLVDIQFSSTEPYWCAVGRRAI